MLVRCPGDHECMETPGYLDGVRYPAMKADLVRAATDAGAPPEYLDRLDRLEEDRYEDADSLGRELARSRASSNPHMVALVPQPCEKCGFLRTPGDDHSCIDEKAAFADAVQSITDEFETLDGDTRP